MKLGRDGRLWPETGPEHLIFWPIIVGSAVALFVLARWLRDYLISLI